MQIYDLTDAIVVCSEILELILYSLCVFFYSYDTWIPASEIEAPVEDAPTPEKPRKVM